MSFIIKNMPTNEINNKNREHFFSLEMKEDYSFKYIPESHFKCIVKNVQRQRRKEDEDRIWSSFVKEQELNSLRYHKNIIKDTDQSIKSMKDLLQENIQDVDRELKRLEEDALPEQTKGIQNDKSNIKNEKIYVNANSIRSNFSKDKLLTKNKDTSSINALDPISQDNNISIHKKSEGLKTVFRSKAKKSLSDSLITEKKCYTNQLLHATDYFENNSSTGSSNYRYDIVNVQPDPLTIQKLLSMQKKIAELLDEISFRLCRIPLPDGDNDLKRRQQQTLEFAIRFSRNYLYNLNRLVASIRRHISTVSSRTGSKQYYKNIAFHQDMIKQKLISAHQLLIQALSAYYKHIPNSILDGHSTKLQDVLQIVCNLKNICDKVGISNNYLCSGDNTVIPLGCILQDKCDAILSMLKLNLESKHRSTNYKNVESTVTIAPIPLHHKGRSKRKNLSTRLSMYSMDVKVSKSNQKKRNDLRRKSYICKKESENIIKDIKNIHTQHYSLPELLYPSPITRTSSSRDVTKIDSMKDMNYSKEDDVRTMMDGVTIDSENDSNVKIKIKCKNATNPEQSFTIQNKTSTNVWKTKNVEDKRVNLKSEKVSDGDNLIKTVAIITKEHLASLTPVINNLMALVSKKQNELDVQLGSETSMETLREFLQKYSFPRDSNIKASLANDNYEQSNYTLNSVSDVQKRGENVQLICMSSMEKASKMTQCDVSCQADYHIPLKTSDYRKTMDLYTKDGVQLVVPKETERHFVAYKCEYKKLCQSKPMYSSSTQNKPWDIVAWISDKLIDELIIEITVELQMNDVIKKLFEMEFQEF
ncbi:hypothetical protein WH47_04227 [Habropoda laboriosa]|uniref:Uncharacterized protein n=1 Tax=Habropoda laboriosa TaxID=597456 RepID=A0A0L7QVM2_9HYME|nr:hypothetical protein WH47_04227 [Habropoda laboriosa]